MASDGTSPLSGASRAGPMTDARRADMCAVLAKNWWALALRGVLGILFGLIALVMPIAAMLSLALVFGVYLLIDGIFGIVSAVRAAQRHERWGLLLGEGVLDLIMGVIALVVPASAVFAFVIITAAWAIVTGVLMVAAAFRLGRGHGR